MKANKPILKASNPRKRMFLLCGCVFGLIGILNFLNVILTNMITRHKEFAVLQSVGMTGRQLKKMLILEGELLTLGSVCFSLLLTVVTAPLLLLIAPVFALLGVLVPLSSYRQMVRKSIVERLREGT